MVVRFVVIMLMVCGVLWAPIAFANANANDNLQTRINALYEKVFEDPGNVSLNLELVRSQIQLRDFKGASGTLERLLILAPQNRSAQLLMAQVKVALNNFQEAKFLLTTIINADDTDAATQSRAEEMLLSVNTLIDGFSWQASVEVSGGVSQNPENKPGKTSYSLLLPSSPINVSGAAQEFLGGSISGVIEKRFNTYDATKLRVALAHQRRDYTSYDKSDYEVYSGSFALIKGDDEPLGGTVSLMRVRVRERDFMDQIGIESQKSIMAPFGVNLTGKAYIGRQVHRDHINFSGNQDKTGFLAKLGVAGMVNVNARAIRASLNFDRKDAHDTQYSYHQTKLKLDTNISFFGLNILGQASVADKRFDSPDMIYSERRRRDKTANLSLEMQLPVNQILPKGYHDLRVSLRGDVTRSFSNIDRFDSTKSEVMLKANYALGGR